MQKISLSANNYSFLRMLFGLLLLFPVVLNAQTKTFTGIVTDQTGLPVAGATVMIKNALTGTSTDEEGRFSINAETGNVLVISSVNFDNTEITLGNETSLKVVLNPSSGNLENVVVVGYATQKKVNVTGAVSTISSAELSSRPITNVSSGLAGLAAGVFVRQGSGKPGYDGATIRIRGTGSLNNSDALIVVDGIITSSMDVVNPADIETMSILKDAASASIYGAQGANGVILITTKQGKRGKTNLNYTGMFSSAKAVGQIDFVSDYARHMSLINESVLNLQPTAAPIFSQQTIDDWKAAAANPNGLNSYGVPNWLAYPNTDWYDAVFENNLVQNHNISVSGGTDKLRYLMSMNYLNNPGIMRNTGTERYQFRINLESKINKVLTVGTQTFASLQSVGMANTDLAFNYLSQTTPGLYPYYDGKYGYPSALEESGNANNIISYLDRTGGKNNHNRINTTLYATFDIFKGLSFISKVNYQQRTQEQNTHTIPTDRWDFATNTLRYATDAPNVQSSYYGFNKDYMVTLDNVLRYNTQIGDHSIGALAGYNEYYFNYYDFSATKKGLIDYNITTLGAVSDIENLANGQESDRSMRSWFGRLNYGYKDKYLVEANLRYDGSSRFDNNYRWGYFPSVSVGWRISEEEFFQKLTSVVTNLKLRASWGELGNNGSTAISNDYLYQSVYGAAGYSFNGLPATGLRQRQIPNPALLWESTTQKNIALEATLFNSLNLEVDVYERTTNGIITAPPVPLVLGTALAPYQNTSSALNRGVEVTVGWNKMLGDVRLNVSGNMGYNKTTVTQYKGKLVEGFVDVNGNRTYMTNIGAVALDPSANSMVIEDKLMYEFYMRTPYQGNGSYYHGDGAVNINGGPRDGMIRTVEDLNWVRDMIAAGYTFAPVSGVSNGTNTALLNYGDLIYADNNGDGIYGSDNDRKFTNTSTAPKFNFGFNFGLQWKNFDMSMLWSGSTGMQYYWNNGLNTTTTRNGFHITEAIANDHYYFNEANPSDPNNNINGKFPRLKHNSDAQNQVFSTFWLYDASFFKLRNLQIGYTIPARIAEKAMISNARIYLSGENLLLITNYPGMDPELGTGMVYPTLRQFSAGITLNF
jgi:TonB-linked SusC/RagA family outer membrane protein